MDVVNKLENKINEGKNISREEAMQLYKVENEEALFEAANRIRIKFCGNHADLCSIMNAKSGRCLENCKYCAQSVHYSTGVKEYDLVTKEEALNMSKENAALVRNLLTTVGHSVEEDKKMITELGYNI